MDVMIAVIQKMLMKHSKLKDKENVNVNSLDLTNHHYPSPPPHHYCY